VLIDELPGTSQTAARDTQGWTVAHELAAQTVEGVSSLLHAFLRANTDTKKRSRIPKPVEIPRPWKRARKPPATTPADRLKALAGSLRRR